MKKFTWIIFSLVLSGCASRNVAHDPKSFRPYSAEICFFTEEPMLYTEKRGMDVTWEQGIKAGWYRPVLQDDKGYYFAGPENAICQGSPKCVAFGSGLGGDGGIWVSKTDENDVHLFVIFTKNDDDKNTNVTKDPGLIINALINADIGKYFIFDRNEAFSKALIAKRTQCKPQ